MTYARGLSKVYLYGVRHYSGPWTFWVCIPCILTMYNTMVFDSILDWSIILGFKINSRAPGWHSMKGYEVYK